MRLLYLARVCVLPLSLLLAESCRRAPGGPPQPDAESIIEGSAGPDVHVDSVDAPFEVAIERGRWRPRSDRNDGLDFWTEIAHLDMAHAERAATTFDERTFAAAVRTLLAGDPDAAAVAFVALTRSAVDPIVRSRSRVGLTMALTWNSDWVSIAAMPPDIDSLVVRDPLTVQAGVERWAHAFLGLPPATVVIPEQAITLPLRRSAFGTPVVTVSINGKPHEFWLDTGASMTLLSVDVAVEAGVRLAAPDTLALGVVNGHIDARAVVIDTLAIGGFVAHGLTAAIVSRNMLRLDRSVDAGVSRTIPIDGVIGADLIRQMDIVIDARAGTLTIGRPRRASRQTTRNLFWVGFPVVRLISKDGQQLLFGLDTGAEGSYVTTTLLRKLPHTSIAARRGAINGLGTATTRTEFVAREIHLSDGDFAVVLRYAPVTPARRWTFVDFDGIIGSDVALATRLHLDFTNGVFDVRPSDAAHRQSGPTVTVTP